VVLILVYLQITMAKSITQANDTHVSKVAVIGWSLYMLSIEYRSGIESPISALGTESAMGLLRCNRSIILVHKPDAAYLLVAHPAD
jgi:hypothetical protein